MVWLRPKIPPSNKKNADLKALWSKCSELKKKKKEAKDGDKATKKAAKKAYDASLTKVDEISIHPNVYSSRTFSFKFWLIGAPSASHSLGPFVFGSQLIVRPLFSLTQIYSVL